MRAPLVLALALGFGQPALSGPTADVARPLKKPVVAGNVTGASVADSSARPERIPLPRPPNAIATATEVGQATVPTVLFRAPEVAVPTDPDPAVTRADAPVPDVALAGASLFPKARPSAPQATASVPAVAFLSEPRPLARPVPPDPTTDSPAQVLDAAAVITQPAPSITTGRKGAVCGDPAIKGTALTGISSRVKGCGMGAGAKITSIDGIQMSPAVTIDCTTALALRAWITDGLRPAVGKRGGGVKTIEVMGGYDCRPVNNKPGNKISEHGRGNAIDIGGFVLANGEVIRVLWHWGKGQQGRILKAMHWAACNDFGTVLGPAANSYHRNHFHFDTARRRSSYCR